MSLERLNEAPEIQNHTLREIRDNPDKSGNVLIVDPGEYRASSCIGMLAGLEELGIEAADFSHIIVNSSGSFGGMGFAMGQIQEMIRYCLQHSPSETLDFSLGAVKKGRILQVEKLLNGIIAQDSEAPAEEWYKKDLLGPNYQGPIIHVVCTNENGDPVYLRSDKIPPSDLQKAIRASLTIPRFSEPIHSISPNPQEVPIPLVDGFIGDPVMYDRAKALGGKRIVKLGNSRNHHIEEGSEKSYGRSFWLKKFPALNKFYGKQRPVMQESQFRQMQEDVANKVTQIVFIEPYHDAFFHPTLTCLQGGFNSNIGLGRMRMRDIATMPEYSLPDLRVEQNPKTIGEKLFWWQENIWRVSEESLEKAFNLWQFFSP